MAARSTALLMGAIDAWRNARLPATDVLVSTERRSAMPARLSTTIAINATKSTTPRSREPGPATLAIENWEWRHV